MKKIFFVVIGLLCLLQNAHTNAICIVDADEDIYLPLISSDIEVNVNNQIATVTVTQSFINNTGENTNIKFSYPMTETASALQLRWKNNNEWFVADFSPTPQDTILPGGGGGNNNSLAKEYLGDYPLYFNLEQDIFTDSVITFELTFVDLLPYAFNIVEFFHRNDYSSIQTQPLDYFNLDVNLYSDRTIDWLNLETFTGATVTNNGNDASLNYYQDNFQADQDLVVQYQLNANELGLFSFSTFISDTLLHCDEDGQGYMAFIVEPDPSDNTEVIDKIFTLIIDRSGSMGGIKMQQARDAASFITNNLNEGDDFNIIAFDNNIVSFQPDHVPYTLANKNAALDFIETLEAGGSTNISGAFSEAIPDFANSDPNKAKIIIFFTDGQASAGITSTSGILNHVSDLVTSNEVEDLSIFTFGIGTSTNVQLLTLLALQNNGLSEFLGVEELLATISEFYLTIQNPVLLNTEMFFDPELVTETYPDPLPNLFKGQQLIVVGRYQEPADVNVNFSGVAFGQTVSYDYDFALSDTINPELQFLPRLWAKQKMENLYFQFFAADANSQEAQILEDSIISISLCYGVISPFTSFQDNSGGGGGTVEVDQAPTEVVHFIRASPNPFVDQTSFIFTLPDHLIFEEIQVEIWNISGQLVQQFNTASSGKNENKIYWDGSTNSGSEAAPGLYLVVINVGEMSYRAKVVKGI